MGRDVLLVEADLRTPSLAHDLGPAAHEVRPPRWAADDGDRGWPAGARSNVDVPGSGAFALVAGVTADNVPRALTSASVGRIVAEADRPGAVVIVLAPPVLSYADAVALVDRVEGVMVVCDPREVHRSDLERIREIIGASGGSVLGALLHTGRGRLRRADRRRQVPRRRTGGPGGPAADADAPEVTGSPDETMGLRSFTLPGRAGESPHRDPLLGRGPGRGGAHQHPGAGGRRPALHRGRLRPLLRGLPRLHGAAGRLRRVHGTAAGPAARRRRGHPGRLPLGRRIHPRGLGRPRRPAGRRLPVRPRGHRARPAGPRPRPAGGAGPGRPALRLLHPPAPPTRPDLGPGEAGLRARRPGRPGVRGGPGPADRGLGTVRSRRPSCCPPHCCTAPQPGHRCCCARCCGAATSGSASPSSSASATRPASSPSSASAPSATRSWSAPCAARPPCSARSTCSTPPPRPSARRCSAGSTTSGAACGPPRDSPPSSPPPPPSGPSPWPCCPTVRAANSSATPGRRPPPCSRRPAASTPRWPWAHPDCSPCACSTRVRPSASRSSSRSPQWP